VDDLEPLDDLDDPSDKHEYFNLIASYFPVEGGSDASSSRDDRRRSRTRDTIETRHSKAIARALLRILTLQLLLILRPNDDRITEQVAQSFISISRPSHESFAFPGLSVSLLPRRKICAAFAESTLTEIIEAARDFLRPIMDELF
jgi:hypothetical protein